jgi:hypothetical protein
MLEVLTLELNKDRLKREISLVFGQKEKRSSNRIDKQRIAVNTFNLISHMLGFIKKIPKTKEKTKKSIKDIEKH